MLGWFSLVVWGVLVLLWWLTTGPAKRVELLLAFPLGLGIAFVCVALPAGLLLRGVWRLLTRPTD